MEYMKQKETRFDAHGHWNTVHDAEITLDDALAMIDCIEKQYPEAFTHKGGKWAFGTVDYDKIPYLLRKVVSVLVTITDAEP